VLLIVSVILAIKWRKSREVVHKNFMELVAKVPSIKDVQVLEKIGGGAFGEVFRGLMDVSHTCCSTSDCYISNRFKLH
jgi:hypothetical protein